MDKDLVVLRSQQLPNKLSIAGGGDYDKIWIRDNVYVALAFVAAGLPSEAASIYSALFAIIKTYEPTLDLTGYPHKESELLLPRFTINGAKVKDRWSNKQHDAIGILLYGVGQLYSMDHEYVSESEKELIQKLVGYLERCRYWEDLDNGMWEEDPPLLHASSLAACIKGIEAVSSFCSYNLGYLATAKENLASLLPSESSAHSTDMALLSLVWPLGYKRQDIVQTVEDKLLRSNGVARFIGDKYESMDNQEAEWVMGIPWLGIAYYELGNIIKARQYLEQTERLYTENGLPESYLAENTACVHTPLAWSHAMALVLRSKLSKTAR
jgi:phosphorylase kinase alpha/beta subunit